MRASALKLLGTKLASKGPRATHFRQEAGVEYGPPEWKEIFYSTTVDRDTDYEPEVIENFLAYALPQLRDAGGPIYTLSHRYASLIGRHGDGLPTQVMIYGYNIARITRVINHSRMQVTLLLTYKPCK